MMVIFSFWVNDPLSVCVCIVYGDVMCGQMVSWSSFSEPDGRLTGSASSSSLSTFESVHTHTLKLMAVCVCDSVTLYFSLSLR